MRILISGLLLFLIPFFVHVIVWRTRLLRRRKKNIVLIFLALWSAFPIFYIVLTRTASEPIFPLPGDSPGAIHSFLIAALMLPVYLSVYTAVELDSVSSLILLLAEKAGSAGVSRDELLVVANDEDCIVSRLKELLESGLLRRDGEVFAITRAGKTFHDFFLLIDRLFKTQGARG